MTPQDYRTRGQWDVMTVENAYIFLKPELEDMTRDTFLTFSDPKRMCPDLEVSEKMGAWLQS